MTEVRLSALVVAHNEEANLEACLATLDFADEIVVVLDKCTDRSVLVAARFTDRLIEGDWAIEGDRRNEGIAACRGAWVVEVDADERIPPALGAEIVRTVEASDADWHKIPVDNYVGARLVRHGWGASFGRTAHPGLFRRGAKRWGDQRVHPALNLTGRQGPVLKNRLIHYVDRDVTDMIDRLNRYTTARARDLREGGDIGTFRRNLGRIPARFYKCFVRRRGYREGALGFLIALCAGLYPMISFIKARYDDR
ncbi:MAG: glycosyltransferase family 2 protein [Inquilinaceae bacterium]